MKEEIPKKIEKSRFPGRFFRGRCPSSQGKPIPAAVFPFSTDRYSAMLSARRIYMSCSDFAISVKRTFQPQTRICKP